MGLTIVALNNREDFLQFLDTDQCDIKETHEYGGLRTIEFTYTFDDPLEDKQLFKLGNKIWIQGDTNLTDCLYVINTKVEEDYYKKNTFTFEAEEVLVELNNAPLFSMTEITKANFRTYNPHTETLSTPSALEVYVNYNSLEYWFGDYFNIGVVQKCMSNYAERITVTGTLTLMSLLRQIEEETGNVFVTRYEKDLIDNTIHRYLDFLNPINVSKNWEYHINYRFLDTTEYSTCIDDEGNPLPQYKPWDQAKYSIEENSMSEMILPSTYTSEVTIDGDLPVNFSIDFDVDIGDGDRAYLIMTNDTETIIAGLMTNGKPGIHVRTDSTSTWTVETDINTTMTDGHLKYEHGENHKLTYNGTSITVTGHVPTKLEKVKVASGNTITNLFMDTPNGTEQTYVYDDDSLEYVTYPAVSNIDPSQCEFRIVDPNLEVIDVDGVELSWDCSTCGLEDDTQEAVISLVKKGETIGIDCNNKSYAVAPDTSVVKNKGYVPAVNTEQGIVVAEDNIRSCVVPDDSYFEIYDTEHEMTIFRTLINRDIGLVHEEVLDFGFNLDNIQFDIDETDTYSAVSPILKLSDNNGLTKTQLKDLITTWKSLKITKGEVIPMIVQRINVQAMSIQEAKAALGAPAGYTADVSNSRSNYWRRPYKPQDNINTSTPSQSTFEFLRATAYWKAPYSKEKDELHVRTDHNWETEYQSIMTRPDDRDDIRRTTPKMGTTESSDEDVFAIYNQVCNYLKEHETPKINLDVDVANLRNGQFNQYQVHDKVYVKVPDSQQLVTARVTKTVKEGHDIAKNSIEVSNYKTLNNLKSGKDEVIISASNVKFKYPAKSKIEAKLININWDSSDQWSVHYPMNKLLTFQVYKVSDNTRTISKIVYKKRTDENGEIKIPIAWKPGNYEVDITFGGDEEYTDASLTISVNVSGKIVVKKKKKKKKKTTKKKKQVITKTTYWDKYGRSPDKKLICAIGRPSASGDKGGYVFTETRFKNHCPKCGRDGTLMWGIFWAGNEYSNYGKFPGTGNGEGSSAEGGIFCSNQRCDGDWSCQGREHGYTNTNLSVVRQTTPSSKAAAYELRNGKKIYARATQTVQAKKNATAQGRVSINKSIAASVRNTAFNIVGESWGYTAVQKICTWMDNNIHYSDYNNFCRPAAGVLSSRYGNCCDQTRLLFELLDAAGVCQFYDLWYVHVYGHVYGIVKNKKNGNWSYVDPASDYHGCWGYVCQDFPRGSATCKYPTRPF